MIGAERVHIRSMDGEAALPELPAGGSDAPNPAHATQCTLSLPLVDASGAVYAVIELSRDPGHLAFRPRDAARLEKLAVPLTELLVTWSHRSASC